MSVAPWHGYLPRIAILEVNSGISKMLFSQFCICVQRFCVTLQRQEMQIVSVSFPHNSGHLSEFYEFYRRTWMGEASHCT